jgi:DNA-binding CsgD family transcriptional regulator
VTGPVRICLGHVLLAQGRVHDALRELKQAAESPVLTGAESAAALAWAGYARLWLGDLDSAWAEAEQARVAAVSADDHLSTSIAMATLARVSEFRGRLHDALQIIDEAVRLADLSPGRLGHRYPVRVIRGHILIQLDRLEEARSALSAGRQISEDLGVRWPLPAYQVFLSFERMIAGEWDDAIAELEASLALAEEMGDVYSRGYANGVLSLISFHRNDLSRSRDAATAAARDLAGWSPGYRTSWGPWPHALILEADGEPGQALATLASIWDKCASSGFALEYPAISADLVRLSPAAGDIERARDVSAAVTEMASGNEVPWMAGAALRCRGQVENDAEILQAAADAYASGSRPLGLALACEDAGAAFARLGQLDRARPLLDKAISIYEWLDAARDLARAEAVLREAGIRRGRRGSRRRPQIGWDSLTPAERTVASLVAEGLSNPQIGQRLYISARTVQTHLAHVFAKLDITARAQLAAEVSRHQGIKPADVADSPENRFGSSWPMPRLSGQEAREPGAGSRKIRRRVASRMGVGSLLRMASRWEFLPVRYTLRGRVAVSARVMVAAATSGGLPFASRRCMTPSIFANVSSYRARPCGLAVAMAAAASRDTLSAAPLLMLAGSMSTTRTPHGASSWRNASPSAPSAALVASSGPANGGVKRTPIVLTITMRPRARRSDGSMAWVTASWPVTFTSSWRRNASSWTSSAGQARPNPALLTRPSSPAVAVCPVTAAAAAAMWLPSVTSRMSGVSSPPAAERASCSPSAGLRTPA